MNEINQKKRIEKPADAAWRKAMETARAEKAAYLAKFEGRSAGEKYRLAQERVKVAIEQRKRERM